MIVNVGECKQMIFFIPILYSRDFIVQFIIIIIRLNLALKLNFK